LLTEFPENIETNEKHLFAEVAIAAINLMMIDHPATEWESSGFPETL
jgi:hypothetical protein